MRVLRLIFHLSLVLDGSFTAASLFRRIFEYEKKGNEELVEQNRAMEKNLISMAREIEKLRAEQASIDWRPRGIFLSHSYKGASPGRNHTETTYKR